MNKDFFTRELTKLADAFGMAIDSDKWARKAKIYYDKLINVNDMIFGQVVDKIISNEEKFPTISTINEYKNMFIPPDTEMVNCYVCNSSGVVIAKKGSMSYSFRCPECLPEKFNGLPIWEGGYKNRGYDLDTKEVDWDCEDENIIKGMVVLGKESIVWQKAPESCRIKAEELIASGWKPKFEVKI